MSSRFYRPELDVIRFCAFLLVFFHHGLHAESANTPYGAFVAACSFGLPLFFTLSAYLITTLLLKERSLTNSIDLPRFYKRRALRIWPLYFGALAISALAAALHKKLNLHTTGLWYLAAVFMLGNIVTWQTTSVVHLWSISIEEQFYVFWPSLMRRLSRRSLFIAALVIIGISNLFLAYYGAMHADTWKRIWWNSFVQMEFFGAGILLALHDEDRMFRKMPRTIRAIGLMVISSTFFCCTYLLGIKGSGVNAHGPISLCLGYALVAICCVSLIYLVQDMQQWPRWLIYLGKVSFGLYVFHDPALSISTYVLHQYGSLSELVGALALTICLAWLSYTFYESPFLRLKSRFEVVKSRPVG